MIDEHETLLKIIDLCKKDDQNAQKKLYMQLYSFCKSICLRHTKNFQDAEEIINDIFLKVFNNLNKYDSKKPFKAWFRTIAVNTCIDFYRTKSKIQFSDDLNVVENISLGPEVLDNYSYTELLDVVLKVPFNYRTIFLLFVVEGYSHKEISIKLGINEVTCRTGLNKARKLIQELLPKK